MTTAANAGTGLHSNNNAAILLAGAHSARGILSRDARNIDDSEWSEMSVFFLFFSW